MKFILIPSDIALYDELTGAPVTGADGKAIPAKSFVEFCLESPLRDHGAFGSSIEALESRNAIRDALFEFVAADGAKRRAHAGDTVGIHPNDYEILLRAVKKPSSPYLPQFMGQLLPFFRAIRDAKDQP